MKSAKLNKDDHEVEIETTPQELRDIADALEKAGTTDGFQTVPPSVIWYPREGYTVRFVLTKGVK